MATEPRTPIFPGGEMDEVSYHCPSIPPHKILIMLNSINIFIWAVALLCHAAAKSFGDLFACRVFLGICEGAITPGFMLVTSMFYTRKEQSQRVGYWCKRCSLRIIVYSYLF